MANMHLNRVILVTTIVVGVFCFSGGSFATDWPSCGYDFDEISQAASEQAYAAHEMALIKSELDYQEVVVESARADLESCRDYPEVYDLLDDGCQSYYYEYQSAIEDYNYTVERYNSSLHLFELKLENLTSGLLATEYSCGVSF